MPFFTSQHWLVRMFDFPHAQLTALTFFALLLSYFFFSASDYLILGVVLLLAAAFIYQSTLIYQYTPLKSVESHDIEQANPAAEISLLSANVLMTNRKAEALIQIIKAQDPDVIALLEVDEWWTEKMEYLKKTHPYFIEKPLENLYGMSIYSRLPWKNQEIKYLIENDIPSLEAIVELPSGKEIDLYIVHPRPPGPEGNEESTERDAEILLVGKKVKKKQRPAIVIGDLNDVAWSHTTRLFQKVSGMLDPRIGRGFFNTFHADFPFLRWPLDYAFHSKHFKLANIKRLGYIDSDHFPIYVKLQYSEQAKVDQTAPTATSDEKKEAKKKIEKAQ